MGFHCLKIFHAKEEHLLISGVFLVHAVLAHTQHWHKVFPRLTLRREERQVDLLLHKRAQKPVREARGVYNCRELTQKAASAQE